INPSRAKRSHARYEQIESSRLARNGRAGEAAGCPLLKSAGRACLAGHFHLSGVTSTGEHCDIESALLTAAFLIASFRAAVSAYTMAHREPPAGMKRYLFSIVPETAAVT